MTTSKTKETPQTEETKATSSKPDNDAVIAQLLESNAALTAAVTMMSSSQSKLIADAPKDQILDLRRPEDILTEDDEYDTIDEKWAAIIKDGGIQLYNVLMKPWISRSKSEHSFIVCGLTAAEILYYHHEYDTPEDVDLGTTKAIREVIKVNGMVCATDRKGVYDAMRNTKERGTHIFNQDRVARLFTDAKKIPMTVQDVEKGMPVAPSQKGIFGISLDNESDRKLIDQVVKLAEGGMLSIKYYEDDSTRTSGAGVLWRRTGIMGG